MVRRALPFALAAVTVFAALTPAIAGGGRHSSLVIDANTGAVLHEDDADASRHPASLTKMMTLYLTFETLESGRLKPSDRMTISEAAAGVAPSKLDLDPGETIAVSDAIRAVITKSANDIAVALAEKVGGSQANFVRLMNTRAREIGMSRTNFVNASGLPDDDQVTTARDMATLALHLEDDYPSYFPLFATRAFSYEGKTYRNHNTMLNSFAGIDGIKTGYTRASGFNLVTSFRRGERHLVGVVFGGSTAGERNVEMRVLLTRALIRASARKTRRPAPLLMAKLKAAPQLALRQSPKRLARPANELAADLRPVPKASQPAAVQVAEATPPEAMETAPDPVFVAMQTAHLAPAAATEPPDAPLQIFKVKRVAIAEKAHSPDETTDMEDTDRPGASLPGRGEPSRTDLGRFPVKTANAYSAPADAIGLLASTSEPSTSETMISKLPGKVAAPPQRDGMEMLGASDQVPPITVAPPAPAPEPAAITDDRPVSAARTASDTAPPPATFAQPSPRSQPVVRGVAPSTLTAQANALKTPSKPRRTAVVGLTLAASRYEVQIGAYGSISEAERALASVQDRNAKLLSGIASVTHPAVKDGHQVFRARFTGLDANRAASTCNQLRRQSVDCFVMAGQ